MINKRLHVQVYITDRCKNITLPQTSFVGCKNIYDLKIRSPEHSPLFSDEIDLARVSRLYFTFLDLLPTQIGSPKNIHKENVFVGDQIRLALSVVLFLSLEASLKLLIFNFRLQFEEQHSEMCLD